MVTCFTVEEFRLVTQQAVQAKPQVSGGLAFSPVPCSTPGGGALAPPYKSSAGLSVEKSSVSGCLHCPAGN